MPFNIGPVELVFVLVVILIVLEWGNCLRWAERWAGHP